MSLPVQYKRISSHKHKLQNVGQVFNVNSLLLPRFVPFSLFSFLSLHLPSILVLHSSRKWTQKPSRFHVHTLSILADSRNKRAAKRKTKHWMEWKNERRKFNGTKKKELMELIVECFECKWLYLFKLSTVEGQGERWKN